MPEHPTTFVLSPERDGTPFGSEEDEFGVRGKGGGLDAEERRVEERSANERKRDAGGRTELK